MKKLSPLQILLFGYFLVISIGTFLLMLPAATINNSISFIDALFTATSAVCVTGLIVVDTGSFFSSLGQNIILFLIQVGGLGYMVMAFLIISFFKQRISLRSRMAIKDSYTNDTFDSLGSLIVRVVKYTFIIELAGIILISIRFIPQFGLNRGLYLSVFHAVSAFCNAGFSLFKNSLINYTSDYYLNFVFIFLITLGGLGFLVLTELKTLITAKTSLKDLSLHTKMVLIFSLVLILFGFNHFFFIEKLTFIQSLFLSVTARTAGFNTVATEMLKGNSLFVLIVLMFVGASPGGTGGGIKTTTMFTIFLIIWANLRNSENINFMGRSITKYAVRKSISIFFVSALLLFLGVIAISDLEKINFLAVLFEAASALGTVGLSTGITAGFSSATKVILILLMILGRVGPVAFGAALFNLGESKIPTKYSSEKIMLG